MKRNVLLYLAVAVVGLILPGCQEKSTIEKVRDQVRKEYLEDAVTDHAAEILRKQEPDGSWADIDYQDRSRHTWIPSEHLTRLNILAASYEKETKDPALYRGIVNALQFWFNAKCKSDNWWHNDIGAPQKMLSLAWILDEDLPEECREDVCRVLKKIDSDSGPGRPGGDRPKVIGDNAKAALFMRDWEEASRQFRYLEQEAHIANPEEIVRDLGGFTGKKNANPTTGRGLQPDMSFHHRSDGVDNTNTYGVALISQFAYWGDKLKDTEYALDKREIQCVIDFFLEGSLKHTVKDIWLEPGSWNRDLSRPGSKKLSADYAIGLKKICGGYREDELDDAIAVQGGKKDFDKSWCKFFWCSQYFIFQNPQYTASVRMHSNITSNIEYPYNGEAIHSHFRGDGASHLSLDGDEYNGLQAVFDFSMIPGTTSLRVKDFPPKPQRLGKSVFVGGVTDGKRGAAAFDFISEFYDLSARKGWFFFDNGYVCLGAGIRSTEKEPVVTTLEQCNSAGDVVSSGDRIVFNNGVRYESLDGNTLHFLDEVMTGTFANAVSGTTYDNRKDTARVFKLWIDHGIRPQDKHYAYAVLPGAGTTLAADLFKVLCNDTALQAVESTDGKTAMFIFYEAGKASWSGGEVQVSVPCTLLLTEGKAYVSDPSRTSDRVYVSLNGEKHLVPLPVWQHAGESVAVPNVSS